MARGVNSVSSMARVGATLGGVLLITVGAMHAIEAIAAIGNDQHLVVSPNYIYRLDLTAWGWIHLILGLALAVTGIFVLRGETWARWVGMSAAAFSAFLSFAWLPFEPLWTIVVIAVDILVVWALATYISREP
jgi:hypothetical protein